MVTERDVAVTRFRQLLKVRAWPEWPAAMAKLQALGFTEEHAHQIRKGVEEVVLHGSYAAANHEEADMVGQVLSVLLHQGYEVLTPTGEPGTEPRVYLSPFDRRTWLVLAHRAIPGHSVKEG